jgi:hypothetical protein
LQYRKRGRDRGAAHLSTSDIAKAPFRVNKPARA